MANVVLRQLDKTYRNGVHAVGDFNLEISDGELVVIVGPSGCGKSTTLRMIAGLEVPTRGEIWIGNRKVNGVPPAERDVAMVFQNHVLYPHLSVRQNLAFGLKMRRTRPSEIDRRIATAAELLDLAACLERRPHELSGGERQRVALGRAIVREPQVFLLDEPLSHLDAALRVRMRDEIARLHQRLKTTILYVTHDQVEALTLGNRIVVMQGGRVQQIDSPLSIYQRPANRFVALYSGSPPMNFIAGGVQDGMFRFVGGDLHVGSAIADGAALLGVRPEDLLLRGDGSTLGMVTLDLVESAGHETIAHFELAGGRHAVRLPAGEPYKSGDRLQLSVRPDRFHLFTLDGRRLN